MVRTTTHCESEIKALLINHRHCHKSKKCVEFTGRYIKRKLCLSSDYLDNSRRYRLCSNAADMMKMGLLKTQEKNNKSTLPIVSSPSTTSPILWRSPRLAVQTSPGLSAQGRPPLNSVVIRRSSQKQKEQHDASQQTPKRLQVHRHHTRKQPNPYIKLDRLKAVHVRVGAVRERIPTRKRIGHLKKWHSDVLEISSQQYRKSFRQLVLAERKRRVESVAKLVVAAVVDQAKLQESGLTYFLKNSDVAVDVVTLLDCVRTKLQKELKLNLRYFANMFTPFVDTDVGEAEKEDDYTSAVTVLSETTGKGYDRIRKSFMNKFKEIDQSNFPTLHLLTKSRPKMKQLEFQKEKIGSEEDATGEELDANATPLPVNPPVANPNQVEASNRYTDEDAAAVAESHKHEEDKVIGTKIDGTYEQMIGHIDNKAKRTKKYELTGKRMYIDSFDGAEHIKTKKEKVSFVSFSTQGTSHASINNGYSTSSSFGILTWMQLKTEESRSTMLPALRDLYKEKAEMRKEGKYSDTEFVDMHDSKMSYCLTGHSLWNRRHYPYLLCKCKRGEGVQRNTDASFECSIIPHNEQVRRFDRSAEKYRRKREELGENYTIKKHMDWVDEHNLGVSHFGIHPNYLRRDAIRFDIFHMKCAISKNLIAYVRDFVLSQSTEFMDTFHTHLRTFWGEFHMFVWEENRPFAKFQGNELASWHDKIPATIALIRSHFDENESEQVKFIILLLQSWHGMTEFLGLTKVNDRAIFNSKLEEYVHLAKELYAAGSRTTLTKNNEGDRETSYFHVARYYVPKIAKETYENYGIGIGVFTMQGYERRNKESKNTLRRFSNKKGDIVTPNLKRLWDVFYNSTNAV